jgi:D-alanyl-D-alanine carboxypeptidase
MTPKDAPALRNALRVLDGWLDYARVSRRIPALSVGIVHKNEILFSKGYGYADVRAHRKATEATCYRIASISKFFTATAIMQLVERGALRLDEAVSHYLPWFRSLRDRRHGLITVRHLLTHTAGVERDGYPHWVTDRFPTLAQLKTRIQKGVSVYAPLERWKYSNLGYGVLGEVISVVSGQRYEDYVRASILEPLRMTHTSPTVTRNIVRTLARGYGRDIPDRPRETFRHPDANAFRAAAGLVSNVPDLCRFMSAHFLGSGHLLSDLSKREMQRTHWADQDADNRYGLGCFVYTIDNTPIVGHGGGFQGFKTAIGIDAEKHMGVAVLTNAIDAPARQLMTGIFRTIYDCMKRGTTRSRTVTIQKKLRRCEGQFATRWGVLEITVLGSGVVAYPLESDRPLRDAFELKYRSPGRFRIASGPGSGNVGEDVTFRFDARGKPVALRWAQTPFRRVRRGRRTAS